MKPNTKNRSALNFNSQTDGKTLTNVANKWFMVAQSFFIHPNCTAYTSDAPCLVWLCAKPIGENSS